MPTWRAFLSSCTYIPSYLLTVSFSGPGKQPPSPFTRLPTPTPHSTPSPSSLPFCVCVCVCVCVCLWVIFPRASAPQSPRVVFAFLRFSPVAPLAPSDWSTPVVTLPKGGCRDSLTAARSQSQVCLLTRLHVWTKARRHWGTSARRDWCVRLTSFRRPSLAFQETLGNGWLGPGSGWNCWAEGHAPTTVLQASSDAEGAVLLLIYFLYLSYTLSRTLSVYSVPLPFIICYRLIASTASSSLSKRRLLFWGCLAIVHRGVAVAVCIFFSVAVVIPFPEAMMDTSFLVETGLETLICPDKHQWSGCGPTEVSLCHGVYLAVLSQFCGAVFTLVWCDPYVVDWTSETRSQLIAVDWLSETKWQLIGLQKPNRSWLQLIGLQKPNRSWLDFRNQIAYLHCLSHPKPTHNPLHA